MRAVFRGQRIFPSFFFRGAHRSLALKRPEKIKSAPKEIVFENVSFSYPGSEKLALDKISLTIKRGEDIAVVGHNGAGKTTLIKLLLRFYDPTEGRILVDGTDLKKIKTSDWYKQISVLFQDFAKYNLTLKENVQFGSIGSKRGVKEFLKKAQGEDVLKIKGGLEQTLGSWFENGEEISIGQWQKVAIARALYRNAPFLILDEPTSNIDPQAEYEIFNNLKSLYKRKNLVFISHRFSTVRMADKIYVLDKGKLVEQGSHQELFAKDGLYRKFFDIQKKGYE
jgi:ATP-binding cassette subfamily B protein